MPVALRERMAISQHQLTDALGVLQNHVPQGVILSTCNRTEIYADSAREHGIAGFLKAYSGCSEADFLPHSYVRKDGEAVRHLFRVACGLDSMIIGEHEVLGQVRVALEKAEETRLVSLPLLNLLRNAVRIGREVRERTGISRNALSVSSVAVSMAARTFGDIARCKVVVLGAGEAGQLVARAAKERGAEDIVVVSRSQERAASLVAKLGSRWAHWTELPELVKASDLIISCTGSPHVVLEAGPVEEAMKCRPDRPLVVIDIAVPRDVDPDIGEVRNVFLYNIDQLNREVESNRSQREEEVAGADRIIDAEVGKFNEWWEEFDVRPTITALVAKAETIRQTQLSSTLKKLHPLTEEEQSRLEAMTRAIVQKLLHEPIQGLKKNTDKRAAYVEAVNDLFKLSESRPG